MKINDYFVKIKEKMLNLYKNNKKLFFGFLIVISCVASIFVINSFGLKQEKVSKVEVKKSSNGYAETIENKLENLILKMSNINDIDVFVMINNLPEDVYLKQTETTKTTNSGGETNVTKEEIVFEKNGSSQVPVKISTIYPEITGVLIYISKIDSSTKILIQNAVSGVLNIDSSRIYILQDR